MKFVIIIGNGFDIDLGLKTSFSEFINSYEFKTLADIPLIKYIRKKHDDNLSWCDIEGAFREALYPNPEGFKDIDINFAWQSITIAWEGHIKNITQKEVVSINRDSCAYTLLSQTKSTSNWFSFNYTSPFYLSGLGEDNQQFVHNSFVPKELNIFNDIQIIQKNLIIGVDSNIPEYVRNNEKLSPIIKQNNYYYNDNCLIQALFNADNIIVYGHALGITDSDYFKPFFDNILNGSLQTKTIYIITDKESSFEKIKANLKTYNIDYDILIKRATIVPIYTMNGPNDKMFRCIIDLMR